MVVIVLCQSMLPSLTVGDGDSDGSLGFSLDDIREMTAPLGVRATPRD